MSAYADKFQEYLIYDTESIVLWMGVDYNRFWNCTPIEILVFDAMLAMGED